jgi:hypothetical protein
MMGQLTVPLVGRLASALGTRRGARPAVAAALSVKGRAGTSGRARCRDSDKGGGSWRAAAVVVARASEHSRAGNLVWASTVGVSASGIVNVKLNTRVVLGVGARETDGVGTAGVGAGASDTDSATC